ncbi:hypothetical protein ACU686_11335 [Yinghuangia aomiensis]
MLNTLGERFMARYDPERMELSTRDRVALAAYTEIKEGRGTPKGGVWLDVSHLPRETIMERLPRGPADAAGTPDARHHPGPDRDRPHRPLLDGGVWSACRRPRHRCGRACTRSGRRRAACTGPTASAGTR